MSEKLKSFFIAKTELKIIIEALQYYISDHDKYYKESEPEVEEYFDKARNIYGELSLHYQKY